MTAADRLRDLGGEGSRAAIRSAAKVIAQDGRIITIGSVIAARAGFTGMADYSATKAAIVGYSRGAARDLGPRGITVNVIQPGAVATDMNPPEGGLRGRAASAQGTGPLRPPGGDRGGCGLPRRPGRGVRHGHGPHHGRGLSGLTPTIAYEAP
ncbi:SDR family NAD(P)-dependent oxidoreductase [Nonomuraea sp. KM88]|uniref:SDR family NAD(P)-dependent oxidoreductase n=1 Tax=Nonomuraea sp. KM88 TaxID=3457427 RepID=UPI003FCE3CC1